MGIFHILMIFLLLDGIIIGPTFHINELYKIMNREVEGSTPKKNYLEVIPEGEVAREDSPMILGDYVKLSLLLASVKMKNVGKNPYIMINSDINYRPLSNKKVLIAIYNITYSVLGEQAEVKYVARRDFPILVTEGITDEKGWLNITVWAPLWKAKIGEGLWVYPNTYYNLTLILTGEINGVRLHYLIYNHTLNGTELSLYINGSILPCMVNFVLFLVRIYNNGPLRDALVCVEQLIREETWLRVWCSTTNRTGYTQEFMVARYYVEHLEYMPQKKLHLVSVRELLGKWSFKLIVFWREVKVFEKRVPFTELMLDCPLYL